MNIWTISTFLLLVCYIECRPTNFRNHHHHHGNGPQRISYNQVGAYYRQVEQLPASRAARIYAAVKEPVAVISRPQASTRYHAQDEFGQYHYGYSNGDGQSKTEIRGIDGGVAGKYSYVDPNGKYIELSYVADKDGFRASGDHLPKAPKLPKLPEILEDRPDDEPAPSPVPAPRPALIPVSVAIPKVAPQVRQAYVAAVPVAVYQPGQKRDARDDDRDDDSDSDDKNDWEKMEEELREEEKKRREEEKEERKEEKEEREKEEEERRQEEEERQEEDEKEREEKEKEREEKEDARRKGGDDNEGGDGEEGGEQEGGEEGGDGGEEGEAGTGEQEPQIYIKSAAGGVPTPSVGVQAVAVPVHAVGVQVPVQRPTIFAQHQPQIHKVPIGVVPIRPSGPHPIAAPPQVAQATPQFYQKPTVAGPRPVFVQQARPTVQVHPQQQFQQQPVTVVAQTTGQVAVQQTKSHLPPIQVTLHPTQQQPARLSAPQPIRLTAAPQPQVKFSAGPQPQPIRLTAAPQPQPVQLTAAPQPQPQIKFVAGPVPQPQPQIKFVASPVHQPQPARLTAAVVSQQQVKYIAQPQQRPLVPAKVQVSVQPLGHTKSGYTGYQG